MATRRKFLEVAAASVVSVGMKDKNWTTNGSGVPMRTLGRTGEKVSIVGIGGFHIGMPGVDEKLATSIIRTALDEGINFLDNCWDYNNGESERRMGNALRDGYRQKAFLMTKIDGRNKPTASSQIDDSLKRLQTGHIDLLQFHEVIRASDPDRIFAPGGAIEAALEAKKAGKIRYIGFTGHKSPDVHLKTLATASAHGFTFDAVQMPLNVMDHHFDSFEAKVLPELLKQNIGVLGMKPMGDQVILKSNTVTAAECLHYAMNLPITIGKNQSALVPILQAHIDAEKVTLWNPSAPPLRALWIKNTSGQVLDAGSFNVLEADAFAGEGVLETIHPDERRLLSYAADAAIHVKYSNDSSDKPFSHIRIAKGVMSLTTDQHRTSRVTIRNADIELRQVIVEQPVDEGWKLVPGTAQPEEATESYYRFRVPVDAGKTANLTVEAVHPLESSFELTNLDDDEVAVLLQQKRVTPEMQQAFDRILKQKVKIEQIATQINDRKRESDQITGDQNRIRENMKALKGSSEERALIQRYVGQLDSQETRLATLRKEMADLTAQQVAENTKLDQIIMEVNVDQTF